MPIAPEVMLRREVVMAMPQISSDNGPMDRSKSAAEQWAKGADFLQLDPADAPPGGLTEWLTGRLRLAIADGRLGLGSRLPASRTLAAELRLSRGVVTEAYQRLVEDGLATGHGRAGTIVAAAPTIATAIARAEPRDPRGGAQVLSPFDELRAAPSRVDLSPGLPDLAGFPRAAWLRAERAVLDRTATRQLGYGDPRGAAVFRAEVATWLARNRGIVVDADEVIVVAGVAQALALLAITLHRRGVRAVAVEDPCSVGARQQLQAWGMATPAVGVDERGVRVDELRASGAEVAMLTPAHQFPTGVVLDGERRRELRDWTGDGGLIIEDDYDAEHRYDRPPVSALRAVLPEQVCYTGSVSKLLAPALRIGWLLAPARYRDALVAAKHDSDLGNAALPQLVLAELMASGELERHLRALRRRHRQRRDTMIAAVREYQPGARVHGAAAGLHLMITFAAELSDVDLARAALAEGVKVQPLSWHGQRPGRPGLVLGYAASTRSEIEQGISAVGRVLASIRG
jgi:GntR family transcriptional regulator/MocR family aminotransferase